MRVNKKIMGISINLARYWMGFKLRQYTETANITTLINSRHAQMGTGQGFFRVGDGEMKHKWTAFTVVKCDTRANFRPILFCKAIYSSRQNMKTYYDILSKLSDRLRSVLWTWNVLCRSYTVIVLNLKPKEVLSFCVRPLWKKVYFESQLSRIEKWNQPTSRQNVTNLLDKGC